MYNRKLSDSNFLLAELAKLNAIELMQYIHKYVPLQSFRSLHYLQKIRTAKLNPKDYICFALATDDIMLLSTGKLQRCIDWLQEQPAPGGTSYDVILRSLETIKNVRETAELPNAKVHKLQLQPNCYQNLHHARLQQAALASTDFRLAMLRRAELHKADLRFANFSSVEMERANLWAADLSNAIAIHAVMRRCILTNANLERADLRRAQLQAANLVNTRLFHANLEAANLVAANLEKADLRSANLIGASLDQTELTGANLAGAVFFKRQLLSSNNLTGYLNRLLKMLGGNKQLEMIRHHIAIDLCNQARKLSPKQCRRVLYTAYNHRLFQHIRHRKTVTAINKIYGLFHPDRLNYLETRAQHEMARHIPMKTS